MCAIYIKSALFFFHVWQNHNFWRAYVIKNSSARIQNTSIYHKVEEPLLEWPSFICQDRQYGPDCHSDPAHWPVLWWVSNKITVLNPIITLHGRMSVLINRKGNLCLCWWHHSQLPQNTTHLFLPISTLSQTVLSLNPESHQGSFLPASSKW